MQCEAEAAAEVKDLKSRINTHFNDSAGYIAHSPSYYNVNTYSLLKLLMLYCIFILQHTKIGQITDMVVSRVAC